jgi:hypothetical protein
MVADDDGNLHPTRIPRSFKEATTGPQKELYWDAMRTEYDHHLRAGTWVGARMRKGRHHQGGF